MKQESFADNGPVPKFTTVREHKRRVGGLIEPGRPAPAGVGKNLERVREAFLAAGEHGLTDEELERASGLGPNSARPRRIDLMKRHELVDSGTKRKTRRGYSATVWRCATL